MLGAEQEAVAPVFLVLAWMALVDMLQYTCRRCGTAGKATSATTPVLQIPEGMAAGFLDVLHMAGAHLKEPVELFGALAAPFLQTLGPPVTRVEDFIEL